MATSTKPAAIAPVAVPVGPNDVSITIGGMTCASCVAHVEKAIAKVPGVRGVQVSLARSRAAVSYDAAKANPTAIAAAVSAAGYTAAPESTGIAAADGEEQRLAQQAMHAKAWLRRAIIGICLWLPMELAHWFLVPALPQYEHQIHYWMPWAMLAASTLALLLVGSAFFSSALKSIARGSTNMDVLISMGALVAYGYSVVALAGGKLQWWPPVPFYYFNEASALLALISLGHWLEARARSSAGSAIRELITLAPATALRLSRDGSAREVPIAKLAVGDRFVVRPGDRIALDGVVEAGRSAVDESLLTGESLPVTRNVGDDVTGGTINRDGRLTIRVTKIGGDTALAQIVKLVEQAEASKPPVQRLADQISAVFVPSVLAIALVTALGWYAWGESHHWTMAATWAKVAQTTCSVLIIACPCALGLAVPAAIMVGTGMAAKRGILFRGIDAIQKAERINIVVLDKTGTVTLGKPAVNSVVPAHQKMSAGEILRLAGSAEQFSEHPVGKAVVEHAKAQGVAVVEPTTFNNEAGLGVTATVGDQFVVVGTEELLRSNGRIVNDAPRANLAGRTAVHVGVKQSDGTVERIGLILVSDQIKADSAAAVADLHNMKLRTALLTGDNEATARSVGQLVNVEEIYGNVKPGGKADVITTLQKDGLKVAMVGDGVNDAPALAAADVGIAIGGGSDIAKEAGDIILVSGSLRGVATAVRLSRATMSVIRQNLFLAFAYNVLAIPFAAIGWVNPIWAAAAMALSDVTVIGNALRLRRVLIAPAAEPAKPVAAEPRKINAPRMG